MKAFLVVIVVLIVGLAGVVWRVHYHAQGASQDNAAKGLEQEEPALEAPREETPDPRFPQGYNFALAANGAKASGGIRPEQLIDGNSTQYDGGSGYAYTHWRSKLPESLQVELKQPAAINCVRFLLWDLEETRFYRYKLEVCDSTQADGKWTTVADKTGTEEECRSWQVIGFPKQSVQLIRLTGTFCSVNSSFHVVELQALEAPKGGLPAEPKKAPPRVNGPGDNLEF